jgi:hypothetical protein
VRNWISRTTCLVSKSGLILSESAACSTVNRDGWIEYWCSSNGYRPHLNANGGSSILWSAMFETILLALGLIVATLLMVIIRIFAGWKVWKVWKASSEDRGDRYVFVEKASGKGKRRELLASSYRDHVLFRLFLHFPGWRVGGRLQSLL